MAAVEGGRREEHAAGGTRGRQRRAPGRVSCAGAVGGARWRWGHTAKSRPQERRPRPLTAAVFWRQRVPPPANPECRLPALSGLNCPPAGKGGGGLAMGGGGAGRARRVQGERDKQPPTWLLPPRPPLLQYGLWRPRAAKPRRVSPGPPDTASSYRAGGLSLLQLAADSRFPKPGKRRRLLHWWWWWRRRRPSAWGPRATYLSLGHGGDGGGTYALDTGMQWLAALASPRVALASSSHCSGSGGFIKFL